jgi:hypothetical protein
MLNLYKLEFGITSPTSNLFAFDTSKPRNLRDK